MGRTLRARRVRHRPVAVTVASIAVLLSACGGEPSGRELAEEWIHVTYSPAIQAEACSWGESANTLAGLDWSPYFPFTLNDLAAAWARTC